MTPPLLVTTLPQMPETAHGTASGYGWWGCRCLRCAEWQRVKGRAMRARWVEASHANKAPRRRAVAG
mgnify:CR=1 FL=1